MADTTEKEQETSREIPTEFSLKEQLEAMTVAYKSKKDLIDKNHSAGRLKGPSYMMDLYQLARLKAVGETIRGLFEAEKKGKADLRSEKVTVPAPKKEPEPEPEPEKQPEPAPREHNYEDF